MELLTLEIRGTSYQVDVEVVEKALADYRKKNGTKPSYASKEIDDAEPLQAKASDKSLPEKPGDTVLERPKPPECQAELNRLLAIDKSPIHAKAMTEWSNWETVLTSQVERTQNKVDSIKNEIYQLVSFFSVFQGVLFTAVSGSNLLHCNNCWSPILLSVAASVMTIAGVRQKLTSMRSMQEYVNSEEESRRVLRIRLNHLKQMGVGEFKFDDVVPGIKKQLTRQFWFYFFAFIGLLVFFAVVFPISHWRIACYPGPDPYAEE